MGTAERREREKQQRRESIIEAAEKLCFATCDLDLVTMDDIAKEAELSKGTLYLYFKTKEDLLATMHLKVMKLLKEAISTKVVTAKTGFEIVNAAGTAYINFAFDNPEIFRFMSHKKIFKAKITSHFDAFSNCIDLSFEIFDMLAKAIELGMKDGSLRAGLTPSITAVNLYGQLNGVLDSTFYEDEHILAYIEVNPRILVDGCFDLILHSIQA